MSTTDMKMHINELLSYATYAHKSGSAKFLSNIMKCKFHETDVKSAKQLLWQLGRETLGRFINRNDSPNRKAYIANIEDIMKAIEDLDAVKKLPIFVARDLGKLPDLQPEELNRLYFINRVQTLERSVDQHQDEIENMNRYFMELKDEMRLNLSKMKDEIEKELNSLRPFNAADNITGGGVVIIRREPDEVANGTANTASGDIAEQGTSNSSITTGETEGTPDHDITNSSIATIEPSEEGIHE